MFINTLFAISALLCICGCIALAVTKNIVHSCIYLLFTLIGVAGLYVTLGADFVAVTQIMVYVGGVVILVLFAVMLTGGQDFMQAQQSIKRHLSPIMGDKKSFLLGALSATVLLLTMGKVILTTFGGSTLVEYQYQSTVEELGALLLTDHVLAFEMVSVLLLGALIGSAILARPSRGEKIHEDHQ